MTLISGADHRRDGAAMTYVYAVTSRRAGGVSIGINLNPNNACNWRCVYCQVPGLVRGTPPAVDLVRLEEELRALLRRIGEDAGDAAPRIEDVAFSGNGESTLSSAFADAVDRVRGVLRDVDPGGSIRLRLITNGSRVMNEGVQRGLRSIGEAGGEVWFKVDAGSRVGVLRINDVDLTSEGVAQRLAHCADLVPTWVQTCVFGVDGEGPDEAWLRDYLSLLEAAGTRQLEGVLLYGIARPSMQAEAARLTRLSLERVEAIAEAIRTTGLTVRVSP